VGIAAAQGVALAAGCPVVAIPSILAASSATEGAPCRVVGDARRGSFWISRVKSSGVALAPELTDEDGLRRFLAEAAGEPVVTFEAGARNGFPADLDIARETPVARLLWEAWQKADVAERERWAAEAPQPLYLRPPHITGAKKKF
jgi:tRNA threonylcarbamoyladenosine biosynthesis protein TsaB